MPYEILAFLAVLSFFIMVKYCVNKQNSYYLLYVKIFLFLRIVLPTHKTDRKKPKAFKFIPTLKK